MSHNLCGVDIGHYCEIFFPKKNLLIKNIPARSRLYNACVPHHCVPVICGIMLILNVNSS